MEVTELPVPQQICKSPHTVLTPPHTHTHERGHNVHSPETAREDSKCSNKELTSDYHDCIPKPDRLVHTWDKKGGGSGLWGSHWLLATFRSTWDTCNSVIKNILRVHLTPVSMTITKEQGKQMLFYMKLCLQTPKKEKKRGEGKEDEKKGESSFLSHVFWLRPMFPATQEVETGRLMSSRPPWPTE